MTLNLPAGIFSPTLMLMMGSFGYQLIMNECAPHGTGGNAACQRSGCERLLGSAAPLRARPEVAAPLQVCVASSQSLASRTYLGSPLTLPKALPASAAFFSRARAMPS